MTTLEIALQKFFNEGGTSEDSFIAGWNASHHSHDDTERLDWLTVGEGRAGFRLEYDGDAYLYHFKGSHKGYFHSARKAIDAAMRDET